MRQLKSEPEQKAAPDEKQDEPVQKELRKSRLFHLFFFQHRRWNLKTFQSQSSLILYKPLNSLTAFKLHGLSDRGGEINIPLLALFSLNELNLSWNSHDGTSNVL